MKYDLRRNISEQVVAAAVAALGSGVKRGLGAILPWATYNYQGGVLGGSATGPTYTNPGLAVNEVKLDFAAIAAARTAASQAALAQNDILQIAGVPAGIFVPWVAGQCSTVEGAAATVGVGDTAGGANQYLTAFNLNAKGRTASAATQQTFYNADDKIIVTLNSANGYTKNLFTVFIAMVDLRATRGG